MAKISSRLPLYPALILVLGMGAGLDASATSQDVAGAQSLTLAQLESSAGQGSNEARYELAQRLREGRGVAVDPDRAFKLYKTAAEQGHVAAQYELAKYFRGLAGNRLDMAQSVSLLEKAASGGHAQAQVDLGFQYLNGNEVVPKDLHASFRWFRQAALNGAITAQCMVGDFYRKGQGGAPHDAAEALKWYQLTATTDAECAAKSQYELYILYESGQGTRKDLRTALAWLQRAADANHSRAQYTLGKRYERGDGVERDPHLAKLWVKRSREGVAPHDDHEHEGVSFAGPMMTRNMAPFIR